LTEELKTLVEAVNAVSGDARDVLVCWIVVRAVETLITALGFLGGICLVGSFFKYLTRSVCGSDRLMRSFGKTTECWREEDLAEACKILSDYSK
jgi:hypothetical protein